MNRKLKLIWDFRGPSSQKTAEHHCIHLKEFAQIEKLHFYNIDFTILSEMYTIAFITVDEIDLKLVEEIQKLSPFGVGNEKPVFLLENIPLLLHRDWLFSLFP